MGPTQPEKFVLPPLPCEFLAVVFVICHQPRRVPGGFIGAPPPELLAARRAEFRLSLERRDNAAEALESLPKEAPADVRAAAANALADAEEEVRIARENVIAVESETRLAVDRFRDNGRMIGDGASMFSPQAGTFARMIAEY